MINNHKRNTEGLKKHAAQKQYNTFIKVNKVIDTLIQNKSKINFNTVANESKVSKAYLYSNENIRKRIETLRKQQTELISTKHTKNNMTETSKDVLLAAKNKKIKDLEEENKKLKHELKMLWGKIYDSNL